MRSKSESKLMAAIQLLENLIPPGMQVMVSELKAAAEANGGISWDTMERARAKLGTIKPVREGKVWAWRNLAESTEDF
jgi:hypothetical protein